MQPNLDERHAAKVQALIEIDRRLNDKRAELDAAVRQYDEVIKTKQLELTKFLAAHERKKQNPDKSISEIKDDLAQVAKDYSLREEELKQLEEHFTVVQAALDTKEQSLTTFQQEITELVKDFVQSMGVIVEYEQGRLDNWRSILTRREEAIKQRERTINDLLRSTRASVQEINGKRTT